MNNLLIFIDILKNNMSVKNKILIFTDISKDIDMVLFKTTSFHPMCGTGKLLVNCK
jgi:hypothetical protein